MHVSSWSGHTDCFIYLFKFLFVGGNTGDVFFISKTGKIYTKKILNFEDTTFYDLTVQVMDGGLQSTTTVVRVTIADINDNPPECSPMKHTLTVNETLSIGRTVNVIYIAKTQ